MVTSVMRRRLSIGTLRTVLADVGVVIISLAGLMFTGVVRCGVAAVGSTLGTPLVMLSIAMEVIPLKSCAPIVVAI